MRTKEIQNGARTRTQISTRAKIDSKGLNIIIHYYVQSPKLKWLAQTIKAEETPISFGLAWGIWELQIRTVKNFRRNGCEYNWYKSEFLNFKEVFCMKESKEEFSVISDTVIISSDNLWVGTVYEWKPRTKATWNTLMSTNISFFELFSIWAPLSPFEQTLTLLSPIMCLKQLIWVP